MVELQHKNTFFYISCCFIVEDYYLLWKVWCHFVGNFVIIEIQNLSKQYDMYYETYDSIFKMNQQTRGAGGGRAGGGRAHRVTHKIVKNEPSLKCHHVKKDKSYRIHISHTL